MGKVVPLRVGYCVAMSAATVQKVLMSGERLYQMQYIA